MTDVGDWIYAIKIEGSGDAGAATATDKRTRWCTRALANDPDGLYVPCGLEFPESIGTEISFIDTEVELGEQTFRMQASDELGQLLMRSLFNFFAVTAGDIAAGAAQVPLDVVVGTETDYENAHVYCGRECILLGTWDAVNSEYINCDRGALETVDETHPLDGDNEWYSQQHVLADRQVEFVRVQRGGSYTDEELVWAGVVVNAYALGATTFEIEAADALDLIQAREVYQEPWRGKIIARVLDDEGNCKHVSAEGPGRPLAGYPADRRLSFSVGGKFVVVGKYNTLTLDDGNEITRVSWWLDNESSDQHLLSPRSALDKVEVGDDVWEVIALDPRQPASDGAPGLKTLPLSSNPGTFLAQLLTTTHHGNNGSYDVGKGQLGVGLPTAIVDVAAFEDLAARFAHYELGGLILGADGEPFSAWEMLRRVLRPLQAAPTINEGKISCAVFDTYVDFGDATTLTAAEVLRPPRVVRNLPSAFDSVKVEFGLKDAGGPVRKVNTVGRTARARHYFGRRQSITIDATPYTNPPEFVAKVGTNFVEQFWNGFPVIELESDGQQSLWPGRKVLLTDDGTWGPNGELGVQQLAAIVIGRDYDSATQEFQFVLLGVGVPIERAGYIGPNCKVVDFIAAGASSSGLPEVVVERTYYCDGPGDPVYPDSAGFIAGDKVEFVEFDRDRLSATYQGVEVSGVRENDDGSGFHADYDVIELVNTFGGSLIAGDIMRVAAYPDATLRQRALWVFLADADGFLDGGTDPEAYQWMA